MEQTTIKVKKSTVQKLKDISKKRGREESMNQVILELVERYNNGN